MKTGIYFKKIWSDDDLVELQIDSCDGNSLFSSKVYVGHRRLEDVVSELDVFKEELHGGIYEIQMGAFGPEYANGTFSARLHFYEHSKIHITIEAESEFGDFGGKNVAGRATLYLTSEPVLLDNFITELRALSAGSRTEAKLESLN
jgi:hypothetical protein